MQSGCRRRVDAEWVQSGCRVDAEWVRARHASPMGVLTRCHTGHASPSREIRTAAPAPPTGSSTGGAATKGAFAATLGAGAATPARAPA
jgi:hypothetical protein